MPDKLFLEEYPLLRKFKMEVPEHLDSLSQTAIFMNCEVCESSQTFIMANNYLEEYRTRTVNASKKIVRALYTCAACKKYTHRFYIRIAEDLTFVQKIGQFPPWSIQVDKELEKSLHNHVETFKKGLVCESQNYGIGAFAYYRRIVEEIIDELLASIMDLISEGEKDKYKHVLTQTKQTRVAQEKIELIKDLLPPILKPEGINPLGVLHTKLSEGLHAESDEECLEAASSIRKIITFLVNQVIKSKDSSKEFTDSMRKILEKKSGVAKAVKP